MATDVVLSSTHPSRIRMSHGNFNVWSVQLKCLHLLVLAYLILFSNILLHPNVLFVNAKLFRSAREPAWVGKMCFGGEKVGRHGHLKLPWHMLLFLGGWGFPEPCKVGRLADSFLAWGNLPPVCLTSTSILCSMSKDTAGGGVQLCSPSPSPVTFH